MLFTIGSAGGKMVIQWSFDCHSVVIQWSFSSYSGIHFFTRLVADFISNNTVQTEKKETPR
jgi:hypothetical protein